MIEMNRIYNEDCLEIMKQVPDKYFDLVLTDPPYNTTQNSWDVAIDLQEFWRQINRVNKGATVVFSAQPFTTDLIQANRKRFRYSLIWDKVAPVGFLNANRMPLRVHEDICIFYESLPFYSPIMEAGEPYDKGIRTFNKGNYGYVDDSIAKNETGLRHPKSILRFTNADRQNKQHPTQKPTSIIEYLLRTYADKGFKVFDPFMGSGTTAVACQSLGLQWCGCELDPDYCAIANKRLEQVQGALF